jgi:putative nucleotidyltransferase with HDIG domain
MKPDLYEVAHSGCELVSFPEIYTRLHACIKEPDFSIYDVSKLIRNDPGLTTRLLRIANSPFYGLSQEVDTVARAVSVLGTARIEEMVLAMSAGKVLSAIPNDLFQIEDFWHHSIVCGLVAQYLADHCNRKVDKDSAFVAGLLHDIGQLVLFNKFPGQVRVVLDLFRQTEDAMDMHQAEQQVFGFDHAQLGGELMRAWHLPPQLQECVEFHHQPENAKEYPVEAALINIASTVANMMSLDDVNEEEINHISKAVWEQTGLTPEVINPAVEYASEQYAEVRALLGLE